MQSDVPEVSELCWLLMTGTPLGLLERCHAYKEKKARGAKADAGLFTYPVLMAADILAYDADIVPVGEDQVQHIEVTRDLAGSFNHQFGETFVLPQAKVLQSGARVPGTDGQKMSKSYDNTLEIFEEPKPQRKKIMRIVTDSRPMEEPKEPETRSSVSALLVCSSTTVDARRWRRPTAAAASATARSRRPWRRSPPATLRRPASGESTWQPIRSDCRRFCRTEPAGRGVKPVKFCFGHNTPAVSNTNGYTR